MSLSPGRSLDLKLVFVEVVVLDRGYGSDRVLARKQFGVPLDDDVTYAEAEKIVEAMAARFDGPEPMLGARPEEAE